TICKLFGFLFNLFSIASILSIVAIALDRYSAIIHCLEYSSWSAYKYVGSLTAWIWLQATGSAFMPLFGVGSYCVQNFLCVAVWSNVAYIVLMCILNFFIPLFLMLFCYITIIKVARCHATRITAVQSQARKFSDIDMTGPVATAIAHPLRRLSMISFPTATNMEYEGIDQLHGAFTSDIEQDTFSDLDSYSPINLTVPGIRRDIRTGIRLLGAILAYVVFYFTYVYVKMTDQNSSSISHLEVFGTWMCLLSSVCNPFLYAIVSKRFRLAVRRLCQQRRKRPTHIKNRCPLQKVQNIPPRIWQRRRAGSSSSDPTSEKVNVNEKRMPSLLSLPSLAQIQNTPKEKHQKEEAVSVVKSTRFLEVPHAHASRVQTSTNVSESKTKIPVNGMAITVPTESKNGLIKKWLKFRSESIGKTKKKSEQDSDVFCGENKANIKIQVDLVGT
ncbi:5-hydroxytryptamine receptor 1E-like, partial [Octopus sinensis]